MPLQRDVPHDAIPDGVREICDRLRAAGHRAWVVGGCIRDVLLGKPVSDWDIATSALPDQVTQCFKRVIPTGVQHGTVTVRHHGESYEVTTLRGEGAYSDGRRPDSVFFVTEIERDLARRDFTVNAIAYDPIEDAIVDPFDGIGDMDRVLLRAVGDPLERFTEDGLRVLRAARFVATLELELDRDTERAIPDALETFKKVSRERVRDEWMKTMKAKRPSRAFDTMRTTGILGVTLPDLLEQVDCEQNKWHAYDVWGHSMATLDASVGPAIERVAALLHDIGKPRTRELGGKTNDYTFYGHEKLGAEMADSFLRDYRFSNAERELVVHLVRHHLVCYEADWSDAAVRRWARRIGDEAIPKLIDLARADARGKGRDVTGELALLDQLQGRVDALKAAGAALSTKDLAIDGNDVMKHLAIPPSKRIGEILTALLERVLEDPALNERDALLALAARIAAGEADPR